MSRVLMSRQGKILQCPSAAKEIYESVGYKEITYDEYNNMAKTKAERDAQVYNSLLEEKENIRKLEEAKIAEEWDDFEDEEEDEQYSIIEYVKSTPISELAPKEIREFGIAVGNEPLSKVTRGDQGRKLLEKYFDEVDNKE